MAYSNVEVCGRTEALDTASGVRTAVQGGRDDQPPEDGEAADGEDKNRSGGKRPRRETKRPGASGTREAR